MNGSREEKKDIFIIVTNDKKRNKEIFRTAKVSINGYFVEKLIELQNKL